MFISQNYPDFLKKYHRTASQFRPRFSLQKHFPASVVLSFLTSQRFVYLPFVLCPNTEELAMQPSYGVNLFLHVGTEQRRLRYRSLAILEAGHRGEGAKRKLGPEEKLPTRSTETHTHTLTSPVGDWLVPGGGLNTHAHVVARGRPLHRRTGPSALRPPSPEHTARIGSEFSGGVLLQPPTGPSYKRRRTQGAPGRRAVTAALPSSHPHRAASTAGVRNASAASLECRRRIAEPLLTQAKRPAPSCRQLS